jgi:hypothetical protein
MKPSQQRSEEMKQAKLESQALLRKALVGNALFSISSALTILAFNHWLVRFLGLPEQVSLIVLAIGLVGYAVMLVLNARRPVIKVSDAWVAVLMDAVWVIGSCALLFIVPFSAGGKWLIVLLAEIVLTFAVLQIFGIRRINKGEQHEQPA